MNNYIVYCHTFPNDKKYIGITCQDPNIRWGNGMGYKEQPLIFNAIIKYGWINIRHDILYMDLSEEEAFAKEKELIALYQTNDVEYGYNLTPGGIFVPIPTERNPCSDELRIVHSLKTKESWLDPEVREKRLLAMREKCKEDQYRKNVSDGLKRRLESDAELRLKRSENMKNRMQDQDYKNQCIEKLKQINNDKIKKRILDKQTGHVYESIKEASEKTGVGVCAISKQINGKTKRQRFMHLTKDWGVMKQMQNKHTIILVVGKTGSGKSSLIKKLCERTGLKMLLSYTTRPKRSETDTDHVFVTVEEYLRTKENGEVAIDTELAGNYYYSTIEQLYNADLYTINPEALNRLLAMDLPNIRFVVVYISCPDAIREQRVMKRGDDKHKYRVRDFAEKSEFRKFIADEKWDYAINNLDFPKSYSVLRWIATVEGLWKQNNIERKNEE